MAPKSIFTSFEAQKNKFCAFFGRENLKMCEKLAPKFENSPKMAPKFKISTFFGPKLKTRELG